LCPGSSYQLARHFDENWILVTSIGMTGEQLE